MNIHRGAILVRIVCRRLYTQVVVELVYRCEQTGSCELIPKVGLEGIPKRSLRRSSIGTLGEKADMRKGSLDNFNIRWSSFLSFLYISLSVLFASFSFRWY
jgi:hypothetical protein